MTREEEAFIEGHENALDNRLTGITEEDCREYERLIEKRRQEESNGNFELHNNSRCI